MKNTPDTKVDNKLDNTELRADAEATLKKKHANARMPRSDADMRKQLHELQQAKMEIEAGLARYTDLYDFAPVGYFTLDRDSTLSEINLTGAKLLGLVRSKLIGQRFSAFVAVESQPALQAFLNRVFASDTKQDCELTLLTAHHHLLHVHIGANADYSGQTCRAIMEDISERKSMTAALHKAHAELEAKVHARTAELELSNARLKSEIAERKRAEEALWQSQQELRQLVGHQITIKENERTRIAREIHDELGSFLTGIKANIYVAMTEAERTGSIPSQRLIDAAAQVDAAVETVRRVIADLRPSVLDQLGLWTALEWQAEQTEACSGLKCRFTIDAPAAATEIEIDPERSTALFRIVQETLTNVVRHAHATQVEIRVMRDSNLIRIEVEDDGKGIDSERLLLKRKSWGIAGMVERARYFGGEIRITDTSHGTLMVLRMPLENPVNGQEARRAGQ